MLNQAKHALTIIGRFISPSQIKQFNAALNYLSVGRYLANDRFPLVPNRDEVFNKMAHEVANKRVLYLEFGVFQGDVTRHWSKLLTNPESHLHGFDSFEGLPESWPGTNRDKGHFSTNGNIPEIADPRVKFFKGWFEQTLPTYEPPEHDVLVVNLDADLYSSTAYVLSHISPLIKAGTLIYFDEFNHRDHELRAFDEFRNKCKLRFSPFVASTTLEHIAFRANL
jgi:hypothetical protein